MKVKLECGCIYNTLNKRYEKYCLKHFRIVARNAMVQQNALIRAQMREEKIHQQQLREQKKKSGYYIKPLFK